ncbi:MAG: division/cell wall cluster transcriptional repressor MraZ [Treponema sp.]|jgi:MraZ protein|nr:division/cell wall cluster transcriptional repressor MraZ [Treponema sp.]
MESLTGEFRITLDDKGRLSLPVRLRNALSYTTLFLTRGMDDCLWLYPPNEWKEMLKTIMDTTNPFSAKSRNIRRRLIGPSQEVEIDKAGRIPVAQTLREFAGLNKECVVLGQSDYIEIWDEERYRAYLEAHEDEFISGSEELGDLLKGNRISGK